MSITFQSKWHTFHLKEASFNFRYTGNQKKFGAQFFFYPINNETHCLSTRPFTLTTGQGRIFFYPLNGCFYNIFLIKSSFFANGVISHLKVNRVLLFFINIFFFIITKKMSNRNWPRKFQIRLFSLLSFVTSFLKTHLNFFFNDL